jgi:hypothetical protein
MDLLNKTFPFAYRPSKKQNKEAKQELLLSFRDDYVYPAYLSMRNVLDELKKWKSSFENWQSKKERLFKKKSSKSRVRETSEMRWIKKSSRPNNVNVGNIADLPIRNKVLMSSTPTSLHQISKFMNVDDEQQQLNDIEGQKNENEDQDMEDVSNEATNNKKAKPGRKSLLNSVNTPILEDYFKQNSYPSSSNFRDLANSTLLKVSYLKNWFSAKRKNNKIEKSSQMEIETSQPVIESAKLLAAETTRLAQIATESQAQLLAAETTRLAQIATESQAQLLAAETTRLAEQQDKELYQESEKHTKKLKLARTTSATTQQYAQILINQTSTADQNEHFGAKDEEIRKLTSEINKLISNLSECEFQLKVNNNLININKAFFTVVTRSLIIEFTRVTFNRVKIIKKIIFL